jgi:hypothetical protein
MDLTKLGAGSWCEPGVVVDPRDTVEEYKDEVQRIKVANSVGDLLALSRSKTGRQFMNSSEVKGQSMSMPNLKPLGGANNLEQQREQEQTQLSPEKKRKEKRIPVSALRRAPPGVSYSIQERPANRTEIAGLENELEERVHTVLHFEEADYEAVESGNMFQPHRDAMAIVKDRVFREFDINDSVISREPWLEKLLKCEYLTVTCDEVAVKLTDMLAVGSTEFGNVLRKLRLTYKQSFQQMRLSWQVLREEYHIRDTDLTNAREKNSDLESQLLTKENDVKDNFDVEISNLKEEFRHEKEADKKILAESEFKQDQMAETLRSLNGIFKTMQTDGGATKTADLISKCQRLEKENIDMQAQCVEFDTTRDLYKSVNDKVKNLTNELKYRDAECANLRALMTRRDEAIAMLMEKEALRDAEIEKLLKQAKDVQDQKDDDEDMKEPATAVLCIKCKKSLDDLSNIRAAITQGGGGDVVKLQCEFFRILLPNLRGRRPNRSTEWVKYCIRSILLCKMREDVQLLGIRGEKTRFPQFVYSWFDRKVEGLRGSELARMYTDADEDRWGLYYGVKALSRDDPEAMLFWGLLDETQGEDGLSFMCHVLSILMSMGGGDLWKQFGPVLNHSGNINMKPVKHAKIRQHIWLDANVGIEAVKIILVRALKKHMVEAVDSVEALKVIPAIVDPEVAEEIQKEEDEKSESDEILTNVGLIGSHPVSSGEQPEDEEEEKEAKPSEPKIVPASVSTDTTHINLFMFMRIMLQQFNAERIHRAAAIRLMFETASVGALTPQIPSGTDKDHLGSSGSQVEFPQFYSICRTLFPFVSTAESASLYSQCYVEGKHKVTANLFIKLADQKGLFSNALRLVSLPLLVQHSPIPRPTIKEDVPVEEEEVTEEQFDEDGNPVVVEKPDKVEEKPEIEVEVSKPLIELSIDDHLDHETMLRVKLGTLIHRKLAAIKPDLIYLMNSVPEKWKVMLSDALDVVNLSLNESHSKLKKRFISDQEKRDRKPHHYIDGVQPFVHYRKLLSLALLVKTVTDNHLLPTELFAERHRNILPNMNLSMIKTEKLLSCLEESLLIGSDNETGRTNTKFYRFENVRKNILVRKLQFVFRSFISRNVSIPKSIRLCMRPGYLRGDWKGNNEFFKVKHREVVHDIWWIQAGISDIYAFKLDYDLKASQLRLPPIPLPQAIMAQQYLKWGSVEVAERMSHDLCYGSFIYQGSAPRLRMFCSFLGIRTGLEEPAFSLMQTPQALSQYLNLINEVHRFSVSALNEANIKKTVSEKKNAEKKGEKLSEIKSAGILVPDNKHIAKQPSSSKDSGGMGGLSISGTTALEKPNTAPQAPPKTTEVVTEVTAKDVETNVEVVTMPSKSALLSVDCLFPMKESAFTRHDKRDVWYAELTVLVATIKKWTSLQQGLDDVNAALFIEVTEKLPKCESGNWAGYVEVDDFLWVILQQWIKYSAWYLKRSATRAAWSEKNPPVSSINGSIVNNRNSKMPLNYIQNLIESTYRPSDAGIASKSIQSNIFIHLVTKTLKSNNITKELSEFTGSEFSLEPETKDINSALCEMVLWDTNIGKVPRDIVAYSISNYLSNISGASSLASFEVINLTYASYKSPINTLISEIELLPANEQISEKDKLINSIKECMTLLEEKIASKKQFNNLPRSNKSKTVADCWHKMSTMLSDVANLASAHNKPYPVDAWSVGVEKLLERSPAYSVKISNIIS